ncbi:MAG: MATE family efflux transporter [Lachnospiraceae bacterium]|nr:MATE family efflux transporter [Lachnospiraceae bacterium]
MNDTEDNNIKEVNEISNESKVSKTKNRRSTSSQDMLHGGLAGKMILFALPLALSSILQQLFNSADVAVVGRFAGDDALAAVGANVANVGIFVNLIVGSSAGPNVIVANLIGQDNKKEAEKAVHTTIMMAIIGGLLLACIGLIISKPMLVLTNTPKEVMDMAELYLRIYLLGIPFIMLFNFGAAIIRSKGDTKHPLYIMIASGITNVILNLIFVIGCRMDVAGVALATLISNVLAAFLIVVLLVKDDDFLHLDFKKLHIDKMYLGKIIKVGLPAGLQGMVFSLSNIFIQSGINNLGKDTVAASSVALNFEYFTYDISSAFAQTTVTYTSQNFGAGNYKRCSKIYRIAMAEGMIFTALLSIIFTIWARPLAGLYTTKEAVIDIALIRMFHVMSLEALTATYEVSAAALRSIGYQIVPSLLTVFGTVGFRILWMYTVFKKSHTFETLMNVYPASWIFTGIMVVSAYFILWKKVRMRHTT